MSYDIIAFIVCSLLILAYYLYLKRRTRLDPESSLHSLNSSIREQWVAMVMTRGNMEILAIQTLRNSVMAANFMATTAILLIVGTLNLSEKIEHWALAWHPSHLAVSVSTELWQLKLGLLLLNFSIAFYCFSMAIRYFNHVGYMINVPGAGSTDNALFKKTCAFLNKAGSFYTLGTRSFFFSLPIILWFFGPYFLMLGTIGLICGLAMLDKVPSQSAGK
ncbi:MAG: DUF599 domain-containing protein [Methylicorpusculum sp.]|uniref:DUF599 domain-containing protein n=1 Tax=Methylicorpusculum sp. TaxID=2713644 RepID=UPI002715E446|nr:DUF599 domain-containing protein [Methylicorpusculum sp.]MDO8938234.1 DUF599 domain-containing protein [Methylicorpusculum sp.]